MQCGLGCWAGGRTRTPPVAVNPTSEVQPSEVQPNNITPTLTHDLLPSRMYATLPTPEPAPMGTAQLGQMEQRSARQAAATDHIEHARNTWGSHARCLTTEATGRRRCTARHLYCPRHPRPRRLRTKGGMFKALQALRTAAPGSDTVPNGSSTNPTNWSSLRARARTGRRSCSLGLQLRAGTCTPNGLQRLGRNGRERASIVVNSAYRSPCTTL